MAEIGSDIRARASHARERVEHYVAAGYTIRALVELRALLDETRFWHDPAPPAAVTDAYLASVECFADRGVNEAELKITLHA